MTEAGSIKRAALFLVDGRDGLREHDRGGIEVLASDLSAFREALLRENHTLKRSLTDPPPVFRHRQRLLRRDPARRRPVAAQAHRPHDRRGDRPAP